MANLNAYTREFRYNFKLASPVILGMLGHTFVAFAGCFPKTATNTPSEAFIFLIGSWSWA